MTIFSVQPAEILCRPPASFCIQFLRKDSEFNAKMLFPLLSLTFSAAISGLCVGSATGHRPEDGNSHYWDQRHLGDGENLGVNALKQPSVRSFIIDKHVYICTCSYTLGCLYAGSCCLFVWFFSSLLICFLYNENFGTVHM